MEKRIKLLESATTEDLFFKVEGIHCSSCVAKVSRALEESKLCENFSVDATNRIVRVRKGHVGLGDTNLEKEIQRILKNIGYPAQTVVNPSSLSQYAWVAQLCYSFFGLLISIFFISNQSVPFNRIDLMILLGVIVLFLASYQSFARGAWAALKTKNFGIDTLVTIGAGAAFILNISLIVAQIPGHLFWVEAFSILFLVGLGHYVENYVLMRADKTLRSLMVLAPPKAMRIVGKNKPTEVLVSELKIGDRIQLRAGDRVPVDGIISDGRSDFDESLLTGESVPLAKGAGDEIFAGTINLSGNVKFEVSKLGKDSVLSQIIETVLHLRQSRADIQLLADRIANFFVPVVIVIAIACFVLWMSAPVAMTKLADTMAYALYTHHEHLDLFWKAFSSALGVLVIACPCAMGLATPAALIAVSGIAAKKGILIRDGRAVENAEKITHLFFDKTGTLSVAAPKKVAEWKTSEFKMDLLTPVALASHHPVSRALARGEKAPKFEARVEEFPGEGIRGRVQTPSGHFAVALGHGLFIQKLGIKIPTIAQEFVVAQLGEGRGLVYWAQDENLAAVFAFEDELRPGAEDLIKNISKYAKVFVLSGDNKKVLAGVAQKLGLPTEQVMGELSPLDKVKVLQSYQSQGFKVAFVGDGLNDAPVLQAADLGIAVSSAADLAKQSADIVLLTKETETILEAFQLARKGMKTIRQNLLWAFAYNVIAIPLAFAGLITPVLCTASMAFSDFVIIANSLRVFTSKKSS